MNFSFHSLCQVGPLDVRVETQRLATSSQPRGKAKKQITSQSAATYMPPCREVAVQAGPALVHAVPSDGGARSAQGLADRLGSD